MMELGDRRFRDDGIVCQRVLETTAEQRVVLGGRGGEEHGWEMQILRRREVFGGDVVCGPEMELLLDGDQGVAHVALDVEAVKRR